MKKLIALLGLLVGLIATPALAANCGSYPYTLTNGQTADANQVMANFNAILNCGNNSLAHNGANSDITSLSGLTTPLGVLVGGTGIATATNHGVVLGQGTAAFAVTAAGTSGQVLTSNGSSADPTFQSIPAGGTVTSIATNNGVTGGTITTSGTIGLATITANTALANVTSGSAVPVGVALPSCSATGSALIYTTSSGFGCATGYALGMQAAAQQVISSNTTLADSNAGAMLMITGSPTLTFGTGTQTFILNNFGTAVVTLAYSSGSDFRTSLYPGEQVVLHGDGTGFWRVIAQNVRILNQNSQSASYTFSMSDGADLGQQVYHPSSDTTARTWTIPANSNTPFPIGTKIDVINDCSAGALTLSINTDTLVWFTSGSTGSRTLSACGEATLSKVGSTRWVITGVGLS